MKSFLNTFCACCNNPIKAGTDGYYTIPLSVDTTTTREVTPLANDSRGTVKLANNSYATLIDFKLGDVVSQSVAQVNPFDIPSTPVIKTVTLYTMTDINNVKKYYRYSYDILTSMRDVQHRIVPGAFPVNLHTYVSVFNNGGFVPLSGQELVDARIDSSVIFTTGLVDLEESNGDVTKYTVKITDT
ncbi:hypothetical protein YASMINEVIRUS_1144 [Yasminevirus sp. GU-2018]|uniref:Uncharacterized protein n=1 Tax=Yasminevirus sp. GU-2018 TaxID=2420051 RepID=A0A5K0UAT9_9VIRU|nr:hypothetical protein YASMINEVIRUS_1144 [Yasminevirus sp. GU-2018]